jgi:hypothetical protein
MAALAVLAVPIAALAYLRPLSTPPAQLQLRGKGELAIASWDPRATARGGQLDIFDGGEKVVVGLLAGQSSLTYTPHSVAIEVQLTTDGGAGQPQQESARLITEVHPLPSNPTPGASKSAEPDAVARDPSAAGRLGSEIAALEEESSQLRQSVAEGRSRMALLQKTVASLTHR